MVIIAQELIAQFFVFLAECEHVCDYQVFTLPAFLSQLLFHHQERIQLAIRLEESADAAETTKTK